MLCALEIADYLIHHAQAAFGLMGADLQIENSKHVLRWIERTKISRFTRSEVHNALQKKFSRVEDLKPALQVLVDRHYIRLEPSEKAPNRPSIRYSVNPKTHVGRAR